MASLSLKSRKDIIKALKKARTLVRYTELEIKIAPREELPGHLLILVPKKVGNAPTRNLIKRRIKAIFFEEKLFNFSYNWIFLVRPGLDQWKFQQLRASILESVASLSSSSS